MFLCDPKWPQGGRSMLVRLLTLQSRFPDMILSWPTVPSVDSLPSRRDVLSLANTYGGYITVGYHRDGDLPRYIPSKEPGQPLALRDLIATLPAELKKEPARVSFFIASTGTTEPPAAVLRVPRSLVAPLTVDNPNGPRIPTAVKQGSCG